MNQLILRPEESGTYWRKPRSPHTGPWELCEVEYVEDQQMWIVKILGHPATIPHNNWLMYADQWYWYGPTLVLPPFEVKGFSQSDLDATRTNTPEELFHGFADGVGTIQTDANVPNGFTASFERGVEHRDAI